MKQTTWVDESLSRWGRWAGSGDAGNMGWPSMCPYLRERLGDGGNGDWLSSEALKKFDAIEDLRRCTLAMEWFSANDKPHMVQTAWERYVRWHTLPASQRVLHGWRFNSGASVARRLGIGQTLLYERLGEIKERVSIEFGKFYA